MPIARFYHCDPKDAPKPNMPAHLGANVLMTWNGKLLLEKRSDSDIWGLPGGGAKKYETGRDAIAREVYEELGLRIPKNRFVKEKVYDDPGRIAAFRDGSVWRMVIVAYSLPLSEKPEMWISHESKALGFFTKEEIQNLEIAVTHRDIIQELFLERD